MKIIQLNKILSIAIFLVLALINKLVLDSNNQNKQKPVTELSTFCSVRKQSPGKGLGAAVLLRSAIPGINSEGQRKLGSKERIANHRLIDTKCNS